MSILTPVSASGVFGTTPFGLPYWELTVYCHNGDTGLWLQEAYPGLRVSPGLDGDYQYLLARAQASGNPYTCHTYDYRDSECRYQPMSIAEVRFNLTVKLDIVWHHKGDYLAFPRDPDHDEFSSGYDLEDWEDYAGQSSIWIKLERHIEAQDLIASLNYFRRSFVEDRAWLSNGLSVETLGFVINSRVSVEDWISSNSNRQLATKFAATCRGIERLN